MKTLGTWLNNQLEWAKSFFMEVQIDGDRKASMKRLVSFMIAITFLRAYGSVIAKKMDLIKDISSLEFPDVPEVWAVLLAGIIGLSIVADYFGKKKWN